MSRQGRGNSMCKEERAKNIEKRKCSWISRSKCDVQTHYVVYIKYVQIFVYELHLNKALKMGFSGSSDGRVCLSCRRPGFNPWVASSSGEGNGYPFQYSCLENSMDRGAWRATVYGVLQRVRHE